MAYDEQLAARVRTILADEAGLAERKMFGGIAFMVGGNMCCGVLRDDLIVKFDPSLHDELVARPHVRPFDFSGRPMKGMVYVAPAALGGEAELRAWVERGVGQARSRPPKEAGATSRPRRSSSRASR